MYYHRQQHRRAMRRRGARAFSSASGPLHSPAQLPRASASKAPSPVPSMSPPRCSTPTAGAPSGLANPAALSMLQPAMPFRGIQGWFRRRSRRDAENSAWAYFGKRCCWSSNLLSPWQCRLYLLKYCPRLPFAHRSQEGKHMFLRQPAMTLSCDACAPAASMCLKTLIAPLPTPQPGLLECPQAPAGLSGNQVRPRG